jgi:hypothetical protein
VTNGNGTDFVGVDVVVIADADADVKRHTGLPPLRLTPLRRDEEVLLDCGGGLVVERRV